jgi:hypothetical protein
MLVRIRWSKPQGGYAPHSHEMALACASLLVPSALVAFTLAIWNIAADLRWTSEFIVSRGLLSHWQIWFCISAALLLVARVLNRYGADGEGYGHRDREPASRFQ